MADTFTTVNMRLEQFLFVHDIRFISWSKTEDGLTCWTYERTPELERVVQEYKEIDQRRRERKRNTLV